MGCRTMTGFHFSTSQVSFLDDGLILLSTLLGALLAFVVSLMSPQAYTATASFLPHGGDQGGLSGVSGLAQQFGFSIPRSGDADRSPEFYQDLLQSRAILAEVVTRGVEVATAAGVTSLDLAERSGIKGETPEKRNERTRRYLVEDVISVSVRTEDPRLASTIARRLLDLISTFDLETRQSKASAERGFAEERLAQLRVDRVRRTRVHMSGSQRNQRENRPGSRF